VGPEQRIADAERRDGGRRDTPDQSHRPMWRHSPTTARCRGRDKCDADVERPGRRQVYW